MHRKVVAPGSLLHHKVLHQRTFTTEALLRRNVLHKKPTFHQFFFYTRNVLTPSIPLHQKQKPLTPKSTRRALQTTKLFYTIIPFIPKSFYTRSCLNHEPFTPAGSCAGNTFTPKTKALTPETFYTSRLMHHKP